jgi:hypothetical protein
MGRHWEDGGYSAEVEIHLRVGDRVLRIAQIGPDSFILRDACELPPGTEGTIVMKVDGREKEYHAFLQNGVVKGVEEVAYL